MISLFNEKNQKLKSLSVYEVSEADMGESSISATVSFSEVQDFHPDWYVVYNGEKFRLGVRKPTGKKDTSSLSTSYTLVFKSEREDLKRYTFMDFVELGSGNPQPSSYNVPLYATLSEFVDRFNTNLSFYLGARWKMVLPDDYKESGNTVTMSFDNATLWDVLLTVYEMFGLRWTIQESSNVMQIKVGFPDVELEHIFEYGKGNGLISVERNNALERIITRLRGRGGEKNLPSDYFHTGDPDTNDFLKAIYFKNLMPKSYRDYIRGYNAGSGTGSWAYNKGVQDKVNGTAITPIDYAISDKEDLWGISYGAIEPAEGIFPTLQGATRNGMRLDEVLAVEPVLVDGPREPIATTAIGIGAGGDEDSVGTCGTRPSYMSDCRKGVDFTIFTDKFSVNNSANRVQIRLTAVPSVVNSEGLSEAAEYGNDSTIHLTAVMELVDFSKKITGETIRTYTVEDMDSFLWELEDVPVGGDYRFRIHVTWSADILKEETDEQGKPILVSGSNVVVSVSTRLTGAMVYEYARPEDKNEFKETFDIEIRDVWGISRNEGESDADYTYRVWEPRAVSEEMTVMFSDGLLAGEDYEFRIVGFSSDSDDLYQVITNAIKPTSNGWRLTLQKSDSEMEASGRYLPNTMQNAKVGDHFFFVNIAMPYDPYVYDAEERVQDYLDTQLALKDEEFPSFTITPSRIFCASFSEVGKLRAGAKVKVSNAALIGDTDISLYIQSITKRYTAESFNPEWTITISDQVVASGSPVSILEGNVAILNQRVYSNKEAVKEAIKAMGSTFLRRDGIAADSTSPTEFKKKVRIGKEGISDSGFVNGDINGKGFGVYTDGEGNRVIEADILVGRIGARFNEVKINQVTYSAGKQVFSSAGMVVNKVVDNGNSWRCYFDTENGTKRNHFAVNDGAFSQRFTDAGIRQYWERVVAIGADYIDITKGATAPLVGDNIAQLGNSTNTARQAALIIDETRDGGGLVTWYDDITGFTLEGKDSVNIGRIDGKTWLQVYGAGYIGDREGSQYVKYKDGVLKVKGQLEVGSEIADSMTVVEGGIIQSALLMLGYTSDGVFKAMSGTNGLYDSKKLGGGIAAWYGGPMMDREADNALTEYAQSLFRFDGSGYLASGNITWDKDGAGHVAGGDLSWDKDGVITLGSSIKISGDVDNTLGSILEYVNELRRLLRFDKDNNAIYTPLNMIVEGTLAMGSLGEGGSETPVAGLQKVSINFEDGKGPFVSDAAGNITLPAYPAALKNPYALIINGVHYDGSKEITINLEGGGGIADSVTWENVIGRPTALSEFENDLEFVTYATLNGYATQSWVGDNYLPLSGGTIKGNVIIQGDSAGLLQINRQSSTSTTYITFLGNNSLRGRIGFNSSNQPVVQDISISSDNQLLIHSGNIGEQSVSYADSASVLSPYRLGNLNDVTKWSVFIGDYNAVNNPSGEGYLSGIAFATDGNDNYKTQFGINISGRGYIRCQNGGSWNNWEAVAFLTDNVASATKLQTARSIWGQNFDGTGNVDGVLNLNYSSLYTGIEITKTNGEEASVGFKSNVGRAVVGVWGSGLNLWTENLGVALTVNYATNNILIGTTTDNGYKLDVNGSVSARGGLKVYGICIECDASGVMGSYSSEINNFNGNLYLQTRSGNTYISHTDGTTEIKGVLSVKKDTNITGNLTVTGTTTTTSLKIGNAELVWDDTVKALKIIGSAYTTGTLGMGDLGEAGSGGGGAAGIVTVRVNGYDYNSVNGIVTLPDYPSLSGYATESWVGNNYLPKSGGVIESSSATPLIIRNSTYYGYLPIYCSDELKVSFGYYNGAAYLANETLSAAPRLVVTDSGVPQFWDSHAGTNKYTLYHSGNFNPANYLPLSGGTITNDLTVNGYLSSGKNYIRLSSYYLIAGTNWRVTDAGWQNEYTLLHSGNYSSYALPLSGGTIYGTVVISGNNITNVPLNIATPSMGNTGYIRFGAGASTNELGHLGFSAKGVPAMSYEGVVNTLIHSGNIGSQSVASADYAKKSGALDALTRDIPADERGPLDNSYALYTGGWANSNLGYASTYGTYIDLSGYSTWYHRLAFNTSGEIEHFMGINTTFLSKVGSLAYTTSNVASATKLQTARSIWGQSFDGTGNISGALYDVNGEEFLWSSGNLVRLGTGTAANGRSTYIDGFNVYLRCGTSYKDGLTLNDSGNVTIGASDLAGTNYKLYVNGLAMVASAEVLDVISLNRGYNSGKPLDLTKAAMKIEAYGTYVGFNIYTSSGTTRTNTLVFSDGGNVLIGTTSDISWAKLNVNGSARVNDYVSFYRNNVEYGYVGLATNSNNDIYISATNTLRIGSSTAIINPNSGNVLIGTTTDNGAKLQVKGKHIVSAPYRATFPTLGALAANSDFVIHYDGNSNGYGMYFSTIGQTGYGIIQVGRNDGLTNTYPLLLNPLGGNVLIGTTEDRGYRLQVEGSFASYSYSGEYGTLGTRPAGASLFGPYAYGLLTWVRGDGNAYMQVGRTDNQAIAYNLVMQHLGGNVLIGTTSDNGAKLQVNGGATFGGDVWTEGTMAMAKLASSSDAKLKDNIKWLSADKSMEVVRALRPTEWDWKKDHTHSFGFIAQDVQPIVPEMVSSMNDTLRLEYNQLHAFEIGAIQHIDSEVEQLKRDLKTANNRIEELESKLKQYELWQ